MKHWSIRVKFTVMFASSLIVIVLATFLLVQLISASVLSKTAREYLLASVDANSDAVYFTDDPVSTGQNDGTAESDIRIEYGKGFLIIDKDFLDVINDVYTALYSAEGVLLYGMNPIARQMEGSAFTGTVVRRMRVDGTQYEIYERQITVYGADDLWLRGVMPLTTRAEQLASITRTSAVLLPAMILLAVLYAHLTSGRMLKPLREIERTAAEISAGTDLNRRIAMTGPDDEVHRLADTFDDMIERLGDSFATERQFTSDASHELRTPMAVIMAQCEYTLDKERTVPEYVDALRTIRRQGARMNGLINDMLDFTRMEQRAERYPLTKTDLSALARNTCEDMAMLRTNNITLTSEIADHINVSGNTMLLARLIQNLISNAYRYGRENGLIRVTLKTIPDGRARLTVEDNGIGIAQEDLPHIFERFFRAESSRTGKGTGLGLSMVRRIAELHGADLSVSSMPGEGSTFTVTFPKMKTEGN